MKQSQVYCNYMKASDNSPDTCTYYIDDDNNIGFCKRPGEFRCISDLHYNNPALSYSSVRDYLKCKYLYWLKHLIGFELREPKQSSALKMGVLWDKVLQFHLGDIEKEEIHEIIDLFEMNEFDISKVRAVYRAYKKIGIIEQQGYISQKTFNYIVDLCDTYPDEDYKETMVTGVIDRCYEDHFIENKFTSKPDLYLDIYFLNSQVGTYFLSEPNLRYCIMQIVRSPQLMQTGKYKDETPKNYEERVFQDILSRPSFYFIGFNREGKSYGKKFYRSEFTSSEYLPEQPKLPTGDLIDRYTHIAYEIRDSHRRNAWYKNDQSCLNPFRCDMIDICRYGTVSEELYRIKSLNGKLDALVDIIRTHITDIGE